MTQLHVNALALADTTAALRANASQLQSVMGSVTAQLGTLSESWTGSASTAFQALLSHWQATQHTVELNLEEIVAALSLAQQQYEEVESANLRLFSGR